MQLQALREPMPLPSTRLNQSAPTRRIFHSAYSQLPSQISIHPYLRLFTTMMPSQQELRSQNRKRKRAFEAVPTTELESQPQQTPAKRPKQSHSSRSKTPPEFWDKLSRVPLCRRALREFDRRTIRPITPQQRAKRDVEDSQVKQLQRFARRGGPDLRCIRGVSSVCSMQERREGMLTFTVPRTGTTRENASETCCVGSFQPVQRPKLEHETDYILFQRRCL
jgi:hypothetical protein